jgi:TonB family protein
VTPPKPPPPKPPPPPPPPKPTPKPAPPKPTPKPTPTERAPPRDDAREKAEAEKRDAARKAADDARRAKDDARKAREAQGAGSSSHASGGKASGADAAAYGSTIYSEIARHKNGAGLSESGSVGFTFTVNASGRIVSHAITKSGGPALDARVAAMLSSVQAPPPPGGAFTGRMTIRFSGEDE